MPFWSIELMLRQLRIKKILPFIPLGGTLVDVGCDAPPLTIEMLKDKMHFCIGVDAAVDTSAYENVRLINHWIHNTIPVQSKTADAITMLAVLEHLDQPEAVVKECYRILKPGGTILLTVPSPMNKPVLELLAKLRIVRPEMIAQHKNYFTHNALQKMFTGAGFTAVTVRSFQFGLNTFLKAKK